MITIGHVVCGTFIMTSRRETADNRTDESRPACQCVSIIINVESSIKSFRDFTRNS